MSGWWNVNENENENENQNEDEDGGTRYEVRGTGVRGYGG